MGGALGGGGVVTHIVSLPSTVPAIKSGTQDFPQETDVSILEGFISKEKFQFLRQAFGYFIVMASHLSSFCC